MRTSRRTQLHLETIESRTLLSAMGAAHPLVAAHVGPRAQPTAQRLSGLVIGRGTVQDNIPDAGSMYDLRGVGLVRPMGLVSAEAHFSTTSIAGQPLGNVTLSNRFGRVQLQARVQPGNTNRGLPENWTFTVISATGRFSGLLGTQGTLEIRVARLPNGQVAFRLQLGSR